MDRIIKIDWERQETKTLEFDTRESAVEFLDDMRETLERLGVGAASLRRVEHTVGINIPHPDTVSGSHLTGLLISYELVGGAV